MLRISRDVTVLAAARCQSLLWSSVGIACSIMMYMKYTSSTGLHYVLYL